MSDTKDVASHQQQSSQTPPAGPSEVEPHDGNISLDKLCISGALDCIIVMEHPMLN